MKTFIVCMSLIVLSFPEPAAAKIGDPVSGFMSRPLVAQLRLVPQAPAALTGALSGRTLYRFVSEDGAIVVDLTVAAGLIERQVMYLPFEMVRAYQVNFFLQDALGSVLGATKGLLAYRAAVNNRRETFLTFENLVMRFTPLPDGRLRVVVSRG